MAKTTTLPITQNIKRIANSFTSADTTTLKTIYTAGANDAIVKWIGARSSDTAAVNLALYINDGTTDRIIGYVRVAIASGNDGATAATDLLGGTLLPQLPYDQNGKRVIPMQAGDILKAACLVTMTAVKTLDIFGGAEEY